MNYAESEFNELIDLTGITGGIGLWIKGKSARWNITEFWK